MFDLYLRITECIQAWKKTIQNLTFQVYECWYNFTQVSRKREAMPPQKTTCINTINISIFTNPGMIQLTTGERDKQVLTKFFWNWTLPDGDSSWVSHVKVSWQDRVWRSSSMWKCVNTSLEQEKRTKSSGHTGRVSDPHIPTNEGVWLICLVSMVICIVFYFFSTLCVVELHDGVKGPGEVVRSFWGTQKNVVERMVFSILMKYRPWCFLLGITGYILELSQTACNIWLAVAAWTSICQCIGWMWSRWSRTMVCQFAWCLASVWFV